MDLNAVYLGIDLGGTATKLGIVEGNGILLAQTSFATTIIETDAHAAAFAGRILDFVHDAGVYASEIAGIGLAVPGIVRHGIPELTVNVDIAWVKLLDNLKAAFAGIPIECVNDANAAALGEMWLGAATGAQSAMLVTIGTGIGAGIVADGRVVKGNGGAGEIGHLTAVPNGRLCRCGRKGCVEQYASARGIVASFREAAQRGVASSAKIEPRNDSDALTVFEAYRAGDECAKEAVETFVDKLGFGLAQAMCVVDADVILLGGGVAGASGLFLDDLQQAYLRYCFATCSSTRIKTAQLGNDAGIIGAARYANLMSESIDPLDETFGIFS